MRFDIDSGQSRLIARSNSQMQHFALSPDDILIAFDEIIRSALPIPHRQEVAERPEFITEHVFMSRVDDTSATG